MADNSFIAIPVDIDNPIVLRRTLLRLIEQLDVAFGLRGSSRFGTKTEVDAVVADLTQLQVLLVNDAELTYVKLDGSSELTGILSYNGDKTFTADTQLIAKKYADDNFTNNPQGTDPGDLAQTIAGPSIAEVQAISDKVDAILAELRLANIL